MRARVRHHGHVSVVDLHGNIAIGVGDVRLRAAVVDLLKSGRIRIVLNLKGVSWMDSAGLGELVACARRAEHEGGRIKLLNPSGRVFDLMQITNLQEIFEIWRDERDVLASF
jgi:anti-sigma B factor antagonist